MSTTTMAMSVANDPASKILNNLIVLQRVAHHLPPEDLLPLRPTCTAWGRTFTPALRRKHHPIRLRLGFNVQEFVQLMRSSAELPFGIYIFGNGGATSPEKARQDFQDFVAVCGQAVVTITIEAMAEKLLGVAPIKRAIFGDQMTGLEDVLIAPHHHSWRGSMRKKLVPPPPMKALPKLRRLQFLGYDHQDPDYTSFISDIVQAAIGLESLELNWEGRHDDQHNLQYSVLCRIRDSCPHIQKLKTLATFGLQAPALEILVELARRSPEANPLRLVSFSTTVIRADKLCALLLRHFLSAQSSHLKSLQLLVRSQPGIQVPRLERLNTLKLIDPYYFVAFDGGFVNGCPQLKSLHYMTTTRFRMSFDVNVLRFSHPGVTDLAWTLKPTLLLSSFLNSETWIDERDVLRVLITWPVALTRLELTITEGLDPDVLLTGVWRLDRLEEELKGLRGVEKDAAPLKMETLRSALNKCKTHVGIVDLQQLQELSLLIRSRGSNTLSDLGVCFGLALMGDGAAEGGDRCLRRVSVLGIRANTVSRGAEQLLRSVLGPAAAINLGRLQPNYRMLYY